MDLIDAVPDLAHCKLLFETGFSEKTVVKWTLYDNKWGLGFTSQSIFDKEKYPAPQLKEMLNYARKGYNVDVGYLDGKGYASFQGMPTGNYPDETYHAEFESDTPENALADLIIWQLKTGI